MGRKILLYKTITLWFVCVCSLWACSNEIPQESTGSWLESEASKRVIAEEKVPLESMGNEISLSGFKVGEEDNIAAFRELLEQSKIDVEEEQRKSVNSLYETNISFTPINYESTAYSKLSKDLGQSYIDKLTFLCDSPMYWLWPNGLLKGGQNTKQIWTGPTGTMTLAYQGSFNILDPYDFIEKPIRDVVREHTPEYLVIALGINGISFMDERDFLAEYTDLVTDIQEISPDTKVLFQSIHPITKSYKYSGSITNDTITKANSWILSIAEETGCMYLDTFSVFFNDDGTINSKLFKGDGLHPNVEGLELALEYIRTHGDTYDDN